MTTIENEHFNCVKMVSYKVMTTENQKGYMWHMGHWGTPKGCWGPLGGIRGIGGVRGYWRLARSVGTEGQKGYR